MCAKLYYANQDLTPAQKIVMTRNNQACNNDKDSQSRELTIVVPLAVKSIETVSLANEENEDHARFATQTFENEIVVPLPKVYSKSTYVETVFPVKQDDEIKDYEETKVHEIDLTVEPRMVCTLNTSHDNVIDETKNYDDAENLTKELDLVVIMQ
eukprot:Tbor_TRINITY_DN5586_c3_g1::TRINITY_DN5586_c3_g1_i5::g.12881::m.12881